MQALWTLNPAIRVQISEESKLFYFCKLQSTDCYVAWNSPRTTFPHV